MIEQRTFATPSAEAKCIVCGQRPALNPRGEYPTCGTCRASMCRIGQLTDDEADRATSRAVTRVRRIVAARRGVDALIVKAQHGLLENEETI